MDSMSSGMSRNRHLLALTAVGILAVLALSSFAAFFGNPQVPILSSSTQTKQSNLSPTGDAYVIADLNDPLDTEGLRTLNTGTATFLKVWYAWNVTVSGKEKIVTLAYLKFNLAALHAQSIQSAKLNLYAFVVNLTGSSRALVAYYVSNTSWSEDTLDFDNAPAFNNASFATTSVSAENQWYSFDLTNMAQNQTNGVLSVAITFQVLYEHSQEQVVFYSDRASSNAPYLAVSYIGPSSSGGMASYWSDFVSFVGSSPWIYIIPAAIVAGAGGGTFFFFYSRRNRYGHRSFRKPKTSLSQGSSSPTELNEGSAASFKSQTGAASLAATTASVAAASSLTKSETPTLSCPNCSRQIQSDYSLCPYCGFELPTQCPKCGKALKKDFTRCPYCGTRLVG